MKPTIPHPSATTARQSSPYSHLTSLRWTTQDYQDLTTLLASLAEDAYRDFALRGTPTQRPFLGVRTPIQRQIARAISAGHPRGFLAHTPVSFEEVNLHGFVIAALPYPEMLTYLTLHLPRIDNWANCDCFCASLKSVKQHQAHFLDHFIIPVFNDSFPVESATTSANPASTPVESATTSANPASTPVESTPAESTTIPTKPAPNSALATAPTPEFTTRTALVCLLNYYTTPDYLPVIFDLLPTLFPREEYYIRMGLAWLLSVCFAKFPDLTFTYLQSLTSKNSSAPSAPTPKNSSAPTIPQPLLKLTLQKIRDSHRTTPDWKSRLADLTS